VHVFVLASAIKLTGATEHSLDYDLVKLVLLFAIVLSVSLALYTYYEAPARNWLRGLRNQRVPEVSSAKVRQPSAS
jgi:peptidoglycan/LPS O-acetylase OafA/YrhL